MDMSNEEKAFIYASIMTRVDSEKKEADKIKKHNLFVEIKNNMCYY